MDAALFEAKTPKENALTPEERNALVMSCEKLCYSLARKAFGNSSGSAELEDLKQEALVACMEASMRWQPDRGTKFSTYVTPCIERHLNAIITRIRCEAIVNPESWDDYADTRTIDGDESERPALESLEFTPGQVEALNRLDEKSRQAVILTLEGVAPDRLAERLDLPSVKDAKLILRNAAKQLRRDLAWASRPALFSLEGQDEAA